MTVDPPIYCGFSSQEGWLSRAIRWFTQGDVSHAFLVYWSTDFQCWMTVGADHDGITERRLTTFRQTHVIKYLYGAVGFSLWRALHDHVHDLDTPYAYSALFGMAFVEIERRLGMHPHCNVLWEQDELFCSQWIDELVVEGMTAVSETLAKQWPFTMLQASVIEPAQLREGMGKSKFFAEVDVHITDSEWRAPDTLSLLKSLK